MALDGRAVLFDFGGVLLQQDWGEYDAFGARYGLPEGFMRQALYRTEEWRALQVGKGDRGAWEAAFLRELAAHTGERAAMIAAEWFDRPFGLHEPNLELARALQAAGTRIGLLSNAAPDLEERLENVYALGIAFDHRVISGLVGLAKPDPAIYRLAAEGIGLGPERCFFIDDLEANVAAARDVGMQGHHFRGDYEGLQQALREAGYRW